ncbi:uncharacterized protein LOC133796457 isoform X2 [Humulus lupulus]|uniref:uncharacterized protein LOC133796457 isoform X2 n=1 Tax=Humulus lupulus TaxID=3486 RepID=UPI002B4155D8|nr:uncharacterized protein LOC133796457 isoform X2 [Humulus lupulus]XP_062089956.1 uncharacterized protein LOC133796457 isoform X2 [Humulus lupulus]XP_062089957.1 uncharacterized protein LOC133796457 isoform X2 [Humulus lupulus]XP_062089958.1 uncharacterized protein LOC133796457 isoform X2 [Humulus lupulus]XP_062089959.1 uncharacterized protein LOC133796457 isoform X2 [Humulus lupulus]XP_062089960.1 uncharacterized protein LOC133796457 isoform X2 [Humulus lupulus]XP_062089961.1 uncharacterize
MKPVTKFDSFAIDSRPGEQWVSLKRKLEDEDIKIEATMFDGVVTSSKSGAPVVGKDDVEFHISAEEIESDSVSIRKQENVPAKPYPGPVFKELGENLLLMGSTGGRSFIVMFRARKDWFRSLNQFKLTKIGKPFSSNPSTTGSTSKGGGSGGGDKTESSLTKYDESYRQLDNLNFMTAAKILFTDPPKKKKFGLDFHLVQLFFVLMPSLAVYLVAQYARYEIKRMEQELEVKKKKEDEKKAKELELKAIEEKETGNPELWEVKTRLDKLEESLKKIVVESKLPGNGAVKNSERDVEKKDIARTETSSSKSKSESSTSIYTEREPCGGPNFQEQKPGPGEGKEGKQASAVSNPR